MDAFAEVHAFWWDRPALGEIDELPDSQSAAEYAGSVRECFPRYADFLGDRLSDARRSLYDRVLAALPRLFERVTQGTGLTLIHGDANFWNVLLPRDPHRARALIIDWQLWGISFAAEDLSNLIALHWYSDRRKEVERDLLVRYHGGLVRNGVQAYPWDECWNDYRLAVVTRVLFMPMWQWSSGQRPSSWWAHLERAMQAFDDLGCAELVEG
jgi:thiamine kinase-like enzyme